MSTDSDHGIDWTGERCVPWSPDIQVIYEHYHRYAIAQEFGRGKRVLDLACGEGYGTALLAATAREVVGIDVDVETILHARQSYDRENVTFEVGSITDTSLLDEAAKFDLIVCFEAIEHVEDHDAVMSLIARLLNEDGLLLMSTPDSSQYNDHGHSHGDEVEGNPYHVKELTESAFRELLSGSFEHQAVLHQQVATGSLIVAANQNEVAGTALAYSLHRNELGWGIAAGVPHTYLFAMASNQELPPLPQMSALLDPSQTIVSSGHMALENERLATLYEDSRVEVGRLKSTIANLDELREEQFERAESNQRLAEANDAEMELTRQELSELATELHLQRRMAEREAAMVEWLRETVSALSARANSAERELAELRSVASHLSPPVQRILGKYRTTVEHYAPRGSKRRDVYEIALGRRSAAEIAHAPVVADPSLKVLTSSTPLVSIIIPVHGKWNFTEACLRSIIRAAVSVPFEVIVVNDASPDDTALRLQNCQGIRVINTETNLGFVRACNLGAADATASLLLFLNNDTEIHAGSIEALVATANSDDRIGLVGSKLVYPDGRLQEAGGIIWSDGSGWNFGRNGDANDPAVNVVRDVDYVSGASMLVRRDLFEQVGGFDLRYSPAYYEDTDLAFAIRETGHRVVVQPKSVVVHHEGVSNGTELSSGIKRYQELNRVVFTEKWATALKSQYAGPTPATLWLARQRDPLGGSGPLVLVVDHQVPFPNEDSGSVRMFEIIRQLVASGCRVVFFASNGAEPAAEVEAVQQLGATVLASWDRQFQFIQEAGSEIAFALLSRPQVAWRFLEELRRYAPDATIAYDTVDVHFLRIQRQAELAETLCSTDEAAALRRIALASQELELGLARICDLTFVVSEAEQELLQNLLPQSDIRILSNIHDVDRTRASLTGRSDVLFVGSYNHPPNRDAVIWLATEIMPLVREQLPDALLHVVGSHPTDDILALQGPSVKVHGFVEDLSGIYDRARVAAAPLRFGAGVKGKIGESISHGVPVVSTSMGIEGMHLTDGEDALIADSAEDFAERLIRLLTDDALWLRLSERAKLQIATQFGPLAARTALAEAIGMQAEPA